MIQAPPSKDDTEDLTPGQHAVLKKGWKLLPGFTAVEPPKHKRVIASIFGAQKTGKTSLSLTWPKPIIALNLDMGLDELFMTRPELFGDVQQKKLAMNELTDPETWGVLLNEFHDAYLDALAYADDVGGTVVVDTTTQLWQVVQCVKIEHVRAARLEKAMTRTYKGNNAETYRAEAIERAEKPSQLDWQQANSFMGGLLRRPFHLERVSAVYINRAKPLYDGTQKTDVLEYHGFGEMPAIVQVHIETYKKGGNHFARINDCRFNSELAGVEIVDPSFETFADLIFPD